MPYNHEIAKDLARIALDIGAIQLSPDDPFTWASGYRMPVYNDNRLLLGDYEHRRLVMRGFLEVLSAENIDTDVVAGTATAGIPHATSLANQLETPLIYVRPRAKKHGMNTRIEGILNPGQKVVVVEDLISTGQSALAAVETVRAAGGQVAHCLSIFSYGFAEATRAFTGHQCRLHALLTFEELLREAAAAGRITREQTDILRPWCEDPFGWGALNGFPKILT